MKFTNKSLLGALMVLFVTGVAVAAYGTYLLAQQKAAKKSINDMLLLSQENVIGQDGWYKNDRYGFTLIFAKNWTGCRFEEKGEETVFSLKNMAGEYIPVAKISAIPWGDAIPENAYVLSGTGSSDILLSALVDKDAAQFGGAFAANDYPGIFYDLQHYVGMDSEGLIKSTYASRFTDIEAGDRAGELTVKSISPTAAGTNASQGLASDKPVDLTIEYSGQIVLTGDYEYGMFDPAKDSFGEVCFTDRADPSLIPVLVNYKDFRFCFSNQDDAKKTFAPDGSFGTAEIMISDFIFHVKADGSVENTAKLEKLIAMKGVDEEGGTAEPDTSAWTTYRGKTLGVSVKAPKQASYYTDKATLQFAEGKDTMRIFVNTSDGTAGLDFKIASVKNDLELDRFINTLGIADERGSGCHLGSKNIWQYQDGVYEVAMEAEDWSQGADLGTTTCAWSGVRKILYSPSKQKAMYVDLGQEAIFYLDGSNLETAIDGAIVDTFRFE